MILKFPAGDGRIQNHMEKIKTLSAKDREAWRSWLENSGASKKQAPKRMKPGAAGWRR
jgi:hypothetical protein